MLQRSVLGPILPEAMIWYLENYGKKTFSILKNELLFIIMILLCVFFFISSWHKIVLRLNYFHLRGPQSPPVYTSSWKFAFFSGEDKFAEIFLGEFETPEAIWSTEMRRVMIEKIAAHIQDFSPRLQSNVRALFQVYKLCLALCYCFITIRSYYKLLNFVHGFIKQSLLDVWK